MSADAYALPRRRTRCARLVATLLVAAAAAGIGASSASAWTTAPAPCSYSFSRVFLPWLDVMSYALAPEGDLETVRGWSLAGGAALAKGNEPYYIGGNRRDSRSLLLPSRSSATTRPMCMTVDRPTLRFMARNTGSPLSALEVSVLFEDVTGAVRSAPIGLVFGGSSWAPSPPLAFALENLAGWVQDGPDTVLAFRFTPLGGGSGWQIDDVYVDPFRSR